MDGVAGFVLVVTAMLETGPAPQEFVPTIVILPEEALEAKSMVMLLEFCTPFMVAPAGIVQKYPVALGMTAII